MFHLPFLTFRGNSRDSPSKQVLPSLLADTTTKQTTVSTITSARDQRFQGQSNLPQALQAVDTSSGEATLFPGAGKRRQLTDISLWPV